MESPFVLHRDVAALLSAFGYFKVEFFILEDHVSDMLLGHVI